MSKRPRRTDRGPCNHNAGLTKAEKLHLAHIYWEEHNCTRGPAAHWNSENGIFEYDLFPFVRMWVEEEKVFDVQKPKEPWQPPAADGKALKKRIAAVEDAFWQEWGIKPESHLRAKMIEVELRVRRRLGRR